MSTEPSIYPTCGHPLYGKLCPEMASVPSGKLLELSYVFRGRDIVSIGKAVISTVGKEEAAKIYRKARYDPNYKEGRRLAESLGNPKDLDTYIEAHFLPRPRTSVEEWVESAKWPLWSAPGFFIYRTANKAIWRTAPYCWVYEGIKKFADKEVMEFLAENYCIHDGAFANGFNPDMKFEHRKKWLLGDGCCEFAFEI